MAYKYVDTKLTKNEFEISLNDYAEDSGEQEFTVVTEDKKY